MSTTRRGGDRPPQPGDLAIAVTDLTKDYHPRGNGRSPVRALDGVSFAVRRGTVFGLLGPNGAGKSTTVKILTTLSTPDAGAATVAGLDIHREAAGIRRAIGYVPQQPSFDPTATGRENLLLQGRIHGLPRNEVKQRAARLLARFGLTEAADRVAKSWSGGMQRKLDITLGLIHCPKVLFLDEPTTGLDPEARAELWAEISRLTVAEELTVLLTTHYLDEADSLADHLAIIDRGRVVAAGTPEALKADLGRDSINVEVADPRQAAAAHRAVAAALDGNGQVVAGEAVLRVATADGARVLPRVLNVLAGAGIELSSVTLARPSLDDVYLEYAGRSFQAADAAGAKEVA